MARLMAIMVTMMILVGCDAVSAFTPPPMTPTVAPTATPAAYKMVGSLRTPSCFGGYNTINSDVQIRDEANNIIARSTTTYDGDANFLLYDRANSQNDTEGAAMVLGTVLGTATSAGSAHPRLADWRRAKSERDRKAEQTAVMRIFGGRAGFCYVTFETDIKQVAFYQIRIGTHPGPTYSFDDLNKRAWRVELSMGDD